MREKVCDLIYLDTKRYISLDSLRILFWGTLIIPFIMVGMSIISIEVNGVCWKTLFPITSVAVWSLLYWIFVLTIQSKKTKKTFELRFLVNGISGLFISSLFWLFCTSFDLTADVPIFGIDFLLGILFLYLLFSILYIGLIIFGVHKGVYKKMGKKSRTPKALAVSAFFSAILPFTGVVGMYTSKMLREHASISVQNILTTIAFLLLIFLPALAHINFVQYYYCKKYNISCDECGNTTSPRLERQVKEKKVKVKKKAFKKESSDTARTTKKKVPLMIKILIGVISVPIIAFIILFLVFAIEGFVQGIY